VRRVLEIDVCDMVQGYVFGIAVTLHAFSRLGDQEIQGRGGIVVARSEADVLWLDGMHICLGSVLYFCTVGGGKKATLAKIAAGIAVLFVYGGCVLLRDGPVQPRKGDLNVHADTHTHVAMMVTQKKVEDAEVLVQISQQKCERKVESKIVEDKAAANVKKEEKEVVEAVKEATHVAMMETRKKVEDAEMPVQISQQKVERKVESKMVEDQAAANVKKEKKEVVEAVKKENQNKQNHGQEDPGLVGMWMLQTLLAAILSSHDFSVLFSVQVCVLTCVLTLFPPGCVRQS